MLHSFKYIQNKHFSMKINSIQKNYKLPKISKLYKLNPFLDDAGLLRLGSRLSNSDLDYQSKFPLILPSCNLTELIVRKIHKDVGHLGRNMMQCIFHKDYHVIKCNSLIHKILNECITCKKYQGRPCTQLMSELPQTRVVGDSPAFKM